MRALYRGAAAAVHDVRDLRVPPSRPPSIRSLVGPSARAVFFCFCVSISDGRTDGDRSVFFFFSLFALVVIVEGLP